MKVLLLAALLPLFSRSQTASVGGLVTYFFNDYQGNRPDLGATVYLLDAKVNKGFNIESYDSLNSAILFANLSETYSRMYETYHSMGDFVDAKAKAAEYKKTADSLATQSYIYSGKSLKDLEDRVLSMCLYSVRINKPPQKFIDASGSFTFSNVKPGTYFIYIVSANRYGVTEVDIKGKIYCEKIILKANDSKSIKHNFDINEL